MGKFIVMFALVGSIAGAAAAAQCCGDCDGDGSVAINELITAVNNSLSDCGAPTATEVPESTPTPRPTATPTPPGCPFVLDDRGNGACAFRGRFNRGCGAALDSQLTSDGNTVSVAIYTMLAFPPVVKFAAQVTGATTASLMAWSSDDFQTVHTTAGDLQLTDGGATLVIFPNDPPFMIQSCNFVRYDGEYIGRTRAGRMASDGSQSSPAVDRLRAWRARPAPDLAEP